ncbi:MAG: hypothetical protein WDN49_08150 [Acetobacteraceae bacterium]
MRGALHLQHAVRQLQPDLDVAGVGGPIHAVGQPHLFFERSRQVVVRRAELVDPGLLVDMRAGHEAHRHFQPQPGGAEDPVAILGAGEAVHQLDGLRDLAGNGEGEPAGHEVQVAAVEDGERHGLQQHQRQQDDEQAAPKQRVRHQPLHRGPESGAVGQSHGRRQIPGFST